MAIKPCYFILFRLSSSRVTEASDHIYARVQPKDKRISTASSASMGSFQPPNLLDLIPPPPTYPPSPRSPSLVPHRRSRALTVASEATEETSRLLMTEECDGSLENGYAKLKRNKNKVRALIGANFLQILYLIGFNRNHQGCSSLFLLKIFFLI